MKVLKVTNQTYEGFDNRLSLLDVFYPEKVDIYPVVIFAHGFKGFKDWGFWNVLFEHLSSQGFIVIKFNFSHNGGTANEPIDFPDLDAFAKNTYSKELYDLKQILDLITNKKLPASKLMDENNISLIGHSRGGGISILTAANDLRVKKLICWASVSDFFSRLPDHDKMTSWQASRIYYTENSRTKQQMPMSYEFVEDLQINRGKLDITVAAQNIKCPWCIIHGKEDPVVLVEEAYQLNKLAPHSEVSIIDGANHVFNGKHPFTDKKLNGKLQELLNLTLEFLKR